MFVITDFHGNANKFAELLSNCPKNVKEVVLLGDIGYGFGVDDALTKVISTSDKEFFLIQGNHDNPEKFPKLDNVCSVRTLDGVYKLHINNRTCILIPGAYSYDKAQRFAGIDWWETEEMSYSDLSRLFEIDWESVDTILSHDAPLASYLGFYQLTTHSRTNLALQTLYEMLINRKHKIDWYHGHLHHPYIKHTQGVNLYGLGLDGYLTIF